MYKQKIRELELSVANIDSQLFLLKKQDPVDELKIKTLTQTKFDQLSELSRLNRLQWEEDHEHVQFDDDR